MSSGIYVHIPFCLQRCSYCDFATFKFDETIPIREYLMLLAKELECRSAAVPFRELDSIYFGGGTPSLLETNDIQWIISKIFSLGFMLKPNAEITLEINPGTISDNKIKHYLEIGVNRFSVGCQTMSDELLKRIGRKHNSEQTKQTLRQLQSFNANFSVDLLFALPGQSKEVLLADIASLISFKPNHISPYYLTIPEGHVLQKNRPKEDLELEMFALIEEELTKAGYRQYEISNFSLPGFESKHNLLYWNDSSYWGVGLSAHSYFNTPDWGMRFWNPRSMDLYKSQSSIFNFNILPNNQIEYLKPHESLTDFCHTSLRVSDGISKVAVRHKFGESALNLVSSRLTRSKQSEHVIETDSHWRLTAKGRLLSNQVFSNILFTSSCL